MAINPTLREQNAAKSIRILLAFRYNRLGILFSFEIVYIRKGLKR